MNKSIKIAIGILIVVIVIWGIMFAIDYSRCSNLKEPIFIISKQEDDLNIKSITYQGLGYRVEVLKDISNEYGEQITKVEMYMFNKFVTGAVAEINNVFFQDETEDTNKTEMDYKTKIEDLPQDYSLINAIKDNCVISVHGKKLYNKDELDRFLENINNNNADFMRCISFTIEGDMLITDVNFEGNNSFRVTFDWTRDEWSSLEDRTYKYCRYKIFGKENTENGVSYYVDSRVEGNLDKMYITGYDNDTEIVNNYEFNYLLNPKISGKNEKEKITIGELDEKYEYDIYYYGLESVEIEINDEKMNLKEALLTDKITMEEIIEQAEKDSEAGIICSDMYKEGGTKEYYYGTYTIIKSHSLDGNRDVYIGIPEMKLNYVEKVANNLAIFFFCYYRKFFY